MIPGSQNPENPLQPLQPVINDNLLFSELLGEIRKAQFKKFPSGFLGYKPDINHILVSETNEQAFFNRINPECMIGIIKWWAAQSVLRGFSINPSGSNIRKNYSHEKKILMSYSFYVYIQ